MPTISSRRTRRDRPGLIKAALCLALCALFILAVWLLAGDRNIRTAAESAPAVTTEPPVTPEPTAAPTPSPVPWLLAQTPDAGQEYIDKLYFLGDSVTYQMAGNGFLPFTQIWVPANATLALFNWPNALINYYPKDDPDHPRELSIADTAAACQPEYLVIALGINGVTVLDETQFKRYYRELIDCILDNSPGTKIICQSIFPVAEALTSEELTNEVVNNGNAWIKDVVQEKNVRYLDTHSVLTDDAGGLIPEYSSQDGFHVTPDAYELIFQYIRTHAYQ